MARVAQQSGFVPARCGAATSPWSDGVGPPFAMRPQPPRAPLRILRQPRALMRGVITQNPVRLGVKAASMAFFFITFGFMYVGRKLGWELSKAILYSIPLAGCMALCIVWGAAVAIAIHGLIEWLHPGVILRWIMGYSLGTYVAVPNFGLLSEANIPQGAKSRHLLVSVLPTTVYVICSFVFAL